MNICMNMHISYNIEGMKKDMNDLFCSGKFLVSLVVPNKAELASEPTPKTTPELTLKPTSEPTEPIPEPTLEPAPKLKPEHTVEPTPVSTTEPTLEHTVEPTPEPTAKPTAEKYNTEGERIVAEKGKTEKKSFLDTEVSKTIASKKAETIVSEEKKDAETPEPTPEPTSEPTAKPTAEKENKERERIVAEKGKTEKYSFLEMQVSKAIASKKAETIVSKEKKDAERDAAEKLEANKKKSCWGWESRRRKN